MIYVTQLIHIREGNSRAFSVLDAALSELTSRHKGVFLFRLRPDPINLVASTIGILYEVQLLRFETESAFDHFMNDEERKQLLLSNENAIRSVILIKGQLVTPAPKQSTIL
ncbi:MAG: hypothetical protein LOY03_15780 [Cyclobacteriaceae bacterium]|nr:hypothetical protein [Cyclobacteriaceae bacterium]